MEACNLGRIRLQLEDKQRPLQKADSGSALPQQAYHQLQGHAAVCTKHGCMVCRYAAGMQAHILWSAETASLGDSAAMVDRLNAVDLPTLDISAIEPAQVPASPHLLCKGRGELGSV